MPEFTPFQHLSYRDLLRGWLDANPSRSQAGLAKRIGISRSNVAMVLSGQRDIPLASAQAWATGMGLEEGSFRYFIALVRSDSPLSLELRRKASSEATALRDAHHAVRPTLEQARILGRWYVPVILELARCDDAELSASWFQPRVWPEVAIEELEQAVQAIEALGIASTGPDGRVVLESRPVATDTQLSDELARIAKDYHQVQLEHAAAALSQQGSDRRYLGSLAVAVDPDRIPELIEALQRFQLEAIEPFRGESGSVVQCSIQVFSRTP